MEKNIPGMLSVYWKPLLLKDDLSMSVPSEYYIKRHRNEIQHADSTCIASLHECQELELLQRCPNNHSLTAALK